MNKQTPRLPSRLIPINLQSYNKDRRSPYEMALYAIIIWLSNILALSVPDEGCFRNASCALNLISTFLISFCFLSFAL